MILALLSLFARKDLPTLSSTHLSTATEKKDKQTTSPSHPLNVAMPRCSDIDILIY